MDSYPDNVEEDSAGKPVLRDVGLLLFLSAVILIPSFFSRDLWNPDEPRYMEVAREMVLLNDYVVPHLNGELYPDKPPLFFWLAAGLYRLGTGYNSGRVVAILASVGTVLLTYFIGRRLLAPPGPLLCAVATMTAFLFLVTSRMGVIDPLLMFLTTLSIFCGLRALDPSESHFRRWWIGCYLAAGLAILTKGPVGFMVPLIVLVCSAIARRGKVRKGGWIHMAGLAAMLALVAAWLVPALMQGGEAYSNDILFKQNLGRVMKSYSHRNPFYYYVILLPVILLPWTLFFVPAAWSAFRAWWRTHEPAATLGLA